MNPWLILGFVLAVAAAGGAGLYKGHDLGMAEVQQKWDRERAQQEAQYAAAQAAAREKEQALQAKANKLRQEKDREIRNLNARASALANSLRERPARPTTQSGGVSDTAGTGSTPQSCTGAGLAREDAEFLAREAARGNETRALLKQCRDQYDTVIKMMMDSN
jgi:hypothetical protein